MSMEYGMLEFNQVNVYNVSESPKSPILSAIVGGQGFKQIFRVIVNPDETTKYTDHSSCIGIAFLE